MPSKKVLLIAGSSILVLTVLLFIYSQQKNTPAPTPPVQTIPTPTSISKPAPVTITTARGTITELKKSELTIKFQDTLQVFSISGTKDFQKLVSGTVEAGDAKTVPASINELKVGQEILIIHNIGSTSARSVYIIK